MVPYVIPGFALAKAAAAAPKVHPGAEGMVLMHHGLVISGKAARESYDKKTLTLHRPALKRVPSVRLPCGLHRRNAASRFRPSDWD